MDALQRLTTALADLYAIERELGMGGMATVYLAQDLRHHRKVALKVLRPELSAVLGAERFLQEIRTTANLQHPHILPLHDSGEADGLVYYVMPYIEGETVRDRLNREQQLPVEDAVRITREVASALDYAHRRNVIHRDIKPENILLHEGQALVADFGIALAASSAGGSRMTETGMSLGTPHYMSPEQAMGQREITARSDVYALGCVLYEMLVGEPPFTGPTAQAIVARVVTEQPRSLTLQRHTIPPHVEAAVRVSLEKLPADRFATAAQFADALSGQTGALPVTRAGTAAVPVATPRQLLTRWAPWAAAAALGAIGAWGWLRPGPAPVVTRQRIVLWDRPVPAGVIGNSIAIAPVGGLIVYVDTIGGLQLWAKEPDRVEATVLAGTAGARAPTFSPDGEWIAFIADGKVRKVPRLGGSAITIADSANGEVPALAWLDDGTILYNDPAYNLRAGHQDGGPQRRLLRGDSLGRGVVSVTGLPGAKVALIGTCEWGCPASDLRAFELATSRQLVLVEDVLKGWPVADGRVVFARRDGGVFMAPFDPARLAFRSPPTPVLDGVRVSIGIADMVLGADGTLIYATGGAQAGFLVQPAWIGRDGRETLVDTSWSYIPPANGGIALAPDGRRLAISVRTDANDDIWVKALDNGPLTRLTFGGSNVRPAWSADGHSVQFIASQGLGNYNVLSRRADGTGQADTVFDHARPIWEVVPTRDPQVTIIRLGAPPSRDIMLRRGTDTVLAPLVASDQVEEVAPALSPDGRWLAYASSESGRYEVYVRPFPDANAGRWQVSRNGGNEPAWSHSGRELFFREAGQLVSTAVSPGATFAVGQQRTLFRAADYLSSTTHRYYDVAPGDQRFMFLRAQRRDGPVAMASLVMVTNWTSVLEATARR